MKDFNSIQGDTNPTNMGGTHSVIYLSKDKKYMKKVFDEGKNYLRDLTPSLVETLKAGRIMPEGQYIFGNDEYSISEYHPEFFESKIQFTPDTTKKVKSKIRALAKVQESFGNDNGLGEHYAKYKSAYLGQLVGRAPAEVAFAFYRAERFIDEIYGSPIQHFVLSHNDLHPRNMCYVDDEIFFIDFEFINLSPTSGDRIAFENQVDDPGEENTAHEKRLRFLHSFLWGLRFFTFDEDKRVGDEATTIYFKRFERQGNHYMLPAKGSESKMIDDYGDQSSGKFVGYFKKVADHFVKTHTKRENCRGDYNEFALFHRYGSRDFFGKGVVGMEGHIRNTMQLKKEQSIGRLGQQKVDKHFPSFKEVLYNNPEGNQLRNIVAHDDLDKLGEGARPEEYMDKAVESIRYLLLHQDHTHNSFITFGRSMSLNEYCVDMDLRQEVIKFLAQKLSER